MTNRDDFCSSDEKTLECIENQLSLVIDRCYPQLCSLLIAKELPGDDIRVMLHRRDEHLIVRAHVDATVGLCHQVDGFGRATDKDDFAPASSSEKRLNNPARCLIFLGCPLGEVVHATMHVGVGGLVVANDSFDDRSWLLRGCGVVQIDQLTASHSLLKYRKVSPNSSHVVASVARWREACVSRQSDSTTHPTSSQFLSRPDSARSPASRRTECLARDKRCSWTKHSAWVRTGPTFMRSRHSLANASSSILRAEVSSIPRDRK